MKRNLKTIFIKKGIVLGLILSTISINAGTASAACNHSYEYILTSSSIHLSSTHEFKNNSTGEWMTCTVNKVVDVYVGKCTKCGVSGGQGYTKERMVHLNPLCPSH